MAHSERRRGVKAGLSIACALLATAACKESGSSGTAGTTAAGGGAITLGTGTSASTSTSGPPAFHLVAEGKNLRVRALGPSGIVTAGFPRALVFGGDFRIDASLGRSPLQAQTAWGSAAFGGKWPDSAFAVQLTGGAKGASNQQTILLWKRDRWVKIDEGPAREAPSQVVGWTPGFALVLDPGKECGTLRVVGEDAKKPPVPQLDARMCPQRVAALASGDVVVAGGGFMQRFAAGQASGPVASVIPWNVTEKCPASKVTVAALATSDRGIVVAGRCATGDIALLDFDGTIWGQMSGPDDADPPVAVHRTAQGHVWLLTQKRGHDAEYFGAGAPPAAGSLWYRPKGGLWNRVHAKGSIPADVATELGLGADAGAPTCTPTSFWARLDDDVWAAYDCRVEGSAPWSLVYRTAESRDKSVRLTK
jgi:hypothetical protein